MEGADRILVLVLLMTAAGAVAGVLLVRAIRRLDVAMERRSGIGRHVVRGAALTLAALGLYGWLGVWFERNVWLGLAQAVMCGSVLAHELGLLPSAGRRPH